MDTPVNAVEDPEAFWKDIADKSMSIIDDSLLKMKTQFSLGMTQHLDNFRSIMKIQTDEIRLFRTLETLIKSETLDEEKLKKIFEELDSLRAAAKSGAEVEATVQ